MRQGFPHPSPSALKDRRMKAARGGGAEEGGLTGGWGTGTLSEEEMQVVMGVAEVRDVIGGGGS